MTNSDTTLEYFDLSYSNEAATYYYLVLDFHQRHVDAMWYHRTKNLVTGFARYDFDGNFESLLKRHPFLGAEFHEVIIMIQTPNYLVTPRHGVDLDDLDTFKISNSINEEEESLLKTPLVHLKAEVLYTSSKRFNAEIKKHFKHVRQVSHIAPAIEAELSHLRSVETKTLFSVQISEEYLDIRAYRDQKLFLSNSFFQSGKEDVAYYILYAAEILDIDPQKCALELCGEIAIGDETWQLLSKYWKTLRIKAPQKQVKISQKLIDFDPASFNHLTEALLCAS